MKKVTSMSTKQDSFAKTLKELIQQANLTTEPESVGTIMSFGDGVVTAKGLDKAQLGELIDLGQNEYGMALNLKKGSVDIVTLTEAKNVSSGQTVRRTGRILSIGVSDAILGRIVDPLGQVIDGKPALKPKKFMPLEKVAPGVMWRQSVTEPVQTGIKGIDAMIPIGRGQRELIIGDRATGKTAITLGTILNQAGQDMICIYVSIGQKRSALAQISQILTERGAMDYTIIVAATSSEPAAKQFLAPYAGQAIAEYFLEQGKDVLIVFDDLSKHAQAYREVSLLLRRPSGREAYPGDVFYLHSRLLERACRINKEHGGGSITALPIIETQANDVSAYIPTNVISITDGQIYLETDLFNSGMKPAINVGLSVSRVGSAAQKKAMKQVAGTMKLDLAQFRELEAFAQFSSDLDERTKAQLDRGIRVNSILKQGWDTPLRMPEQVCVIYAAVNGFLDIVAVENIQIWEKGFLEYLHSTQQKLLDTIHSEAIISDESKKKIDHLCRTYTDQHPELHNPETAVKENYG